MPDPDASEDVYAEKLLELLVDATRIRFAPTCRWGLSQRGTGLDTRHRLIRKFTVAPLKTFSISFDDPEFDESGYQNEAVRFLGRITRRSVAPPPTSAAPSRTWSGTRSGPSCERLRRRCTSFPG